MGAGAGAGAGAGFGADLGVEERRLRGFALRILVLVDVGDVGDVAVCERNVQCAVCVWVMWLLLWRCVVCARCV